MKSKSNNQPSQDQDNRVTNNEHHAYRLVIWFGALTQYLVRFGSKPFNEFYQPKYEKRNFIIGFVVQLLVILLIVFLMMIL